MNERIAAKNLREHRDRLPAGATIRPPLLQDLGVCPDCGCTLIRVGALAPRDPAVIERIAIWHHFGNHHVFAPTIADADWRPGLVHNCKPKPGGGGP
jgi:hypothetical protein